MVQEFKKYLIIFCSLLICYAAGLCIGRYRRDARAELAGTRIEQSIDNANEAVERIQNSYSTIEDGIEGAEQYASQARDVTVKSQGLSTESQARVRELENILGGLEQWLNIYEDPTRQLPAELGERGESVKK